MDPNDYSVTNSDPPDQGGGVTPPVPIDPAPPQPVPAAPPSQTHFGTYQIPQVMPPSIPIPEPATENVEQSIAPESQPVEPATAPIVSSPQLTETSLQTLPEQSAPPVITEVPIQPDSPMLEPNPITHSAESPTVAPPQPELTTPQPSESHPEVYQPQSPPTQTAPAIHPGQHYQLINTGNQSSYFDALTSTPAPGFATPAAPVSSEVFDQPAVPTASVPAAPTKPQPAFSDPLKKVFSKLKQRWDKADKDKVKTKSKPIIKPALIGLAVYAVFNSQLIVGQIQYLITPGGTDAPAIDSVEAISGTPEVIIPKINLRAPVVYDVKTFEEAAIQEGLERGVVHYGTTAVPGQRGNNVIVGHSSNNWWAGGKYKFAFVLLNKLEAGDTFQLTYGAKKYTYEVFEKRIIEATDVSVINQNVPEPIVTLVTCDPPGTSWKRLIVQARQIDPNPATATKNTEDARDAVKALPGDGQSIWDKIRELF